MKWSYSKSKIFEKCPRKWYYSEVVASAKSKNSLRREAYLLRQLQSIHAWRGSVVDKVIEKFIVPKMKLREFPSEDETIAFATALMDRQLQFGKQKKYRCNKLTKSAAGDEYCAFYDMEYNGGINEDAIRTAREEVSVSIRNLLGSSFVNEVLEGNNFLVAQRPLIFNFANTTISCTPDLLVFSATAPPLIVDWKVHAFARADFWLQLGIYAIALSRTELGNYLPDGMKAQLTDPTSFRLIEYQLIKNKKRVHSVSPSEIADIEDYIFLSSMQINGLLQRNGTSKEIDIERFHTAHSPRICSFCQFRQICWQKALIQKNLLEVEWT